MNNEKLVLAKKFYNAIENLLDNPHLELSILRSFPNIDIKPKQIFLVETLQFAAFIAEADGGISMREANIINYIAGTSLPISKMQDMISQETVKNLVKQTPLTVKILCTIENLLYRSDAIDNEGSLMNTLISYFQTVGELVADADAYSSRIEYSRIEQYLELIKEYARENTLSPFFDY